jgi:hypothetical protein
VEDPVPALAEAEATGEAAAIFADIRAVLGVGVGVVNLIWRHLATIPGALPWAWGALRPHYRDGGLAAAAAALRTRTAPPDLPAIPPEVLAAAGLGPGDRARIAGVLAAYDRTNPLALVALSALALRLEGVPPPDTARGPPPPEATPALALPPLPPAGALPPDVVALVRRLNALGASDREAAVAATMYRHLAHWPAYLALAWALLAPLAAAALPAAIAACRAAAREAAAALPVRAPPAALPPESRAAVAGALDRFGGEVLPRMVVVCGALRRATAAAAGTEDA